MKNELNIVLEDGYTNKVVFSVLNAAYIISILTHLVWLVYYYYQNDSIVCLFTFLCLCFQVYAYFLNRRGWHEFSIFVGIVSLLAYKLTFPFLGRYTAGNEYSLLIMIAVPFLITEMALTKKVLLTALNIVAFIYINYHSVVDPNFMLANMGKAKVVNAIRFIVAASFFAFWAYIQNKSFTKIQKGEDMLNALKSKFELDKQVEIIKDEQKKYLNELVKAIPGGIFQYRITKSGEVKFLFVNDGSEEIWGITPEEAYADGLRALSVIHPDDYVEYWKNIQESNISQRPIVQTFRIIRADGSIKWVLANSYPKLQPDGSIIRTGSILDITEQKNKEVTHKEDILRSDNELIKLLDLIPQGIFIRNANNNLVWANAVFCEILGEHKDSLINKKLDEFEVQKFTLTGNEVKKMDDVLFSCDKTFIVNEDIELVNKYNVQYHFDIFKTTIKPGFSDENLLLGFLFDTTRYKENIRLKDELIAQVAYKNKNLEEFSFMVSHNIRAQVTNILVLANRLQGDIAPSKFNSYLDYLSKSVNKLDDILRDMNDILNIKRVEESIVEKVDVSCIINSIVADLKMYFEYEDVQLSLNITPDLEIYSMKVYLNSILHNLLSNSFKYRKPDAALLIDIRVSQVARIITIEYSDNGIGFDAEKHRQNIFGLYRRFNTSSSGKGMGLYLVKSHVTAMGGTVEVDSKVGIGTNFKLTIKNFEKYES